MNALARYPLTAQEAYERILAVVRDAVAEDAADYRASRADYLRLVRNDCVNPAGHAPVSRGGRTVCGHCEKVLR